MSDYTPTTWVNGATGLSAAKMNNIETGVDNAHIELQHPVTYVVAASNSTTAEKQAADYLCDGTADQVEINNAITAAAALAGQGGTIVLLGGNYNISGSTLLKSNIWLKGVGVSTTLQIPNATNTTFDMIKSADEANWLYNARISDFYINGNKSNQASGTMNAIQLTKLDLCYIEDVKIYSMKGAGIILNTSTTKAWVDSCWVAGCDGSGIELNATGNYNVISKNYLASNNEGIYLGTSPTPSNRCKIIDNSCVSNSSVGIAAYDSSNAIIKGNHCYGNVYGILLSTMTKSIVEDNIVENNTQIGIYIYSAANDNIINNNTVHSNGTAADNTYANIYVYSNCDYNTIQNNMVRRGANANKPKYGICIEDATCDINQVTNNNLHDSGSTTNLSDAGTGTVTAAGNYTT